jgi:hypothetical protein
MYRRRLASKTCLNYECPHNLFWKGLRLNPEKFKITNRSLEIGNCCCLINEPWTAEEIGEAWGLTMEKITWCEGMAWEKIHEKNAWGQLDQVVFSSLN